MGEHHKPPKLRLRALEQELLSCLADLDGELEPIDHVLNWRYTPQRGDREHFVRDAQRALDTLCRLGLVATVRIADTTAECLYATEAGMRACYGAER